MNCAGSRESFSAYLDEALDPEERSGIEAHLAGCGECRRELERFRQTLALLHRVERPRAPVGFVDRVLAAASPVPWYSRALRGLFFPLRVKLPLEAAVLVLLSIGAVYLYERTPEMEQAAREPASQVAPRPEAPATPPVDSIAGPARAKAAVPRRQLEQEKDRDTRDGKLASVPRVLPSEEPLTAPPASKPAPAVRLEAKKEAAAENVAAPRAAERQSQGGPAQSSPDLLDRRRDGAGEKGQSAAAPPAAPPLAAPGAVGKSVVSGASVSGRLTVKDRAAAEQALGELLARVKATEVTRRRDPALTTVEVLVPKAAYAEFTQGLAKIGGWTVEGEPTELPAQVPVRLRLLE